MLIMLIFFQTLARHTEMRRSAVLGTFSLIKDYKYDYEQEQWCEYVIGVPLNLSKIDFSTILKEICQASVIYEVKGIKRAIIYKNNKGEVSIFVMVCFFICSLYSRSTPRAINKLCTLLAVLVLYISNLRVAQL